YHFRCFVAFVEGPLLAGLAECERVGGQWLVGAVALVPRIATQALEEGCDTIDLAVLAGTTSQQESLAVRPRQVYLTGNTVSRFFRPHLPQPRLYFLHSR